jgi:hypothetical protein
MRQAAAHGLLLPEAQGRAEDRTGAAGRGEIDHLRLTVATKGDDRIGGAEIEPDGLSGRYAIGHGALSFALKKRPLPMTAVCRSRNCGAVFWEKPWG